MKTIFVVKEYFSGIGVRADVIEYLDNKDAALDFIPYFISKYRSCCYYSCEPYKNSKGLVCGKYDITELVITEMKILKNQSGMIQKRNNIFYLIFIYGINHK